MEAAAANGSGYNYSGFKKVRSVGAIAAPILKLWSSGMLILLALQVLTESLILAQNERWRRG